MWELIKKGVASVGLLFLLYGCSATYHLDKAIKKDPKILDSVSVKIDTLIITEPKVIRDTLILRTIDTLKIDRKGVRIALTRFYDTIQVDVECPSDTIRLFKEVKVPQIIYQEKKLNSKYLWILIVSIIIYTLALLRYNK